MGLYFNGKKVRNLYYNGKCITRLALGKEMTRLVEGDDFVRAKWLVGDGSAYIDTLITSYSGIVKVGFDATNSINTSCFFGRERSDAASDFSERFVVVRDKNNGRIYIYGVNTANMLSAVINEITIDIANDIATDKDGTSMQGFGVVADVIGNSLFLFGDHLINGVDKIYDGAISNFEISNQISLTPVQLLAPIPPSLDANGIARNADECGMYNSVNGLFYGNVNTSGTFTVSDN